MKRILMALMCLSLVVIFSACVKEGTNTTTEVKQESAKEYLIYDREGNQVTTVDLDKVEIFFEDIYLSWDIIESIKNIKDGDYYEIYNNPLTQIKTEYIIDLNKDGKNEIFTIINFEDFEKGEYGDIDVFKNVKFMLNNKKIDEFNYSTTVKEKYLVNFEDVNGNGIKEIIVSFVGEHKDNTIVYIYDYEGKTIK